MDLTSTDILFGLGAVAAAVVVASAVYWFSGRLTRPAGPASVPISPAPAGPATPAPAPAAENTTAWTRETTAAWTEDMTAAWAADDAAAWAADEATAWTDDQIAAWAADQPAPQPRTAPGADPSGRHRAPEELLRASTYRLSADRVARAKVLGQPDQVSQAIPSPSRSRS